MIFASNVCKKKYEAENWIKINHFMKTILKKKSKMY